MRSAAWLMLILVGLLPMAGAQAIPEQVHVAQSEAGDGLVIAWAVLGTEYGAGDSPVVTWTVEGGTEKQTQAQKVGQYVTTGGSVVDQAQAVPTHIYAATIGPLEPKANLTYKVGAPGAGMSAAFQTRMLPGADQPLRFVAYGDIGSLNVTDAGTADGDSPPVNVRDLALTYDPDLLIIPGDLSYTNSARGWNRFMRMMEPIQSVVPTMVVPGNHEWEEDNEDAQLGGYHQYLSAYVMPADEQNFVFRAGPVTFIGVNSDMVCNNPYRASKGSPPRPCDDGAGGTPNDGQVEWLEAALKEAQEDANPWTVVYHHHAALSFGRHGTDYAVQAFYVPLYDKYGVDLVVNAHDHVYSRSYPSRGFTPVVVDTNDYPKGLAPVYMVVGGGGRPLYSIPDEEPPPWWAAGGLHHHVARIDADMAELRVSVFRADDGSAADGFTIRDANATGGSGGSANGTPGPLAAGMLTALAAGFVWARARARP